MKVNTGCEGDTRKNASFNRGLGGGTAKKNQIKKTPTSKIKGELGRWPD